MTDPRAPGGPLWAVVGSTGTGKSDAALALAVRVDGEIISVDSAQVFIGMDIGTAKPSPAERALVPHHLIDVISPNTQWSGAAFAEAADRAIGEVRARGRVPILCGGTGLWLRALIRGFFQAPDIDPAVREAVRSEIRLRGPEALHAELLRLDPVVAARLHPRDRQRIARALEVVRQTGQKISELQAAHGFRESRYPLRAVAFDWPRQALIERLARRARGMFTSGLVREVEGLLALGADPAGPGLGSIGYAEAVRHLQGALTLEGAIEATAIATRQYAKRQRNWFRGEPDVMWLPPGCTSDEVQAALEAGPQPSSAAPG